MGTTTSNLRPNQLKSASTPRLRTRALRAACEPLEARVVLSAVAQAGDYVSSILARYGTDQQTVTRSNPGVSRPSVGTPNVQALLSNGYGLQGQYYTDPNLRTPGLTRLDPTVNFNWGTAPPAAGLPAGTFGVRWTGDVSVPRTGIYTFSTAALGGSQLIIAGYPLINRLNAPAKTVTRASGRIMLSAGQRYPLELDYAARGTRASVVLRWAGPRVAQQVVPTTVLSSGVQQPTPPPTVAATAVSPVEVVVAWPAVSGATGYDVQRSTNGGAFVTVATPGATATNYADTGLTPATGYQYRVLTVNALGVSAPSPTASATTPTTGPATPASLSATLVGANVNLTWVDQQGDGTGFVLQRSINGGAFATIYIAPATTFAFTDVAVPESSTIQYRVYAVNGSSQSVSPASAVVNTGPVTPSGVSATSLTSSAIQLAWSDSTASLSGFEIDRSTDGQTFTAVATVPASTLTYTDGGLTASTTYYYRVTALSLAGSRLPSNTVNATTAASDAPQYLLTPGTLATLRQEAASNTPQWQAFKANLDAGLNQVTEGDYQGAELPAIANYALGYQVLKTIDPTTASAYADKAVALMTLGLDGTQDATDTGARMYLARGNGSTTSFTLPNSNINAPTVKVWTPTVYVAAITKGAANGQDAVGYYSQFLNVSNTPDGPANYTQGVDWRYNPDYGRNQIDWSLGSANQPATGSTYYVTTASTFGSPAVGGYTVSGNAITFATAPAANQAIFVEYQYNGPTLKYQQTVDGRGGFNNIQVDTGYTARFLQYLAVGLDWLWSYQGLSGQLRSQVSTMLVRWSDYLATNGYYTNNPSSNYGAGEFALRMATAIALQNRDTTDAPRLLSAMQTYQANNVLPLFQPSTNGQGTEQGGFWAEGWNYGAFAIQNVLTSELAFQDAGWGSAAAAQSWSNDVIKSLIEEQPTQSTIYDGGDGYAYPLPFPSKSLVAEVAASATDSTLQGYANWIVQNYSGSPATDWNDLVFRNPSAPASYWGSALPLQYLSPGTGLAVARKDWNYNSTWLSFHSGNLASADHQDTDQGSLEIDHGADNLLINVAALTGDQTFQDKSTYGNAVVIDDGGAGQQTYRYAQGLWYGNPGVTMPHFEGTSDFAYMQGNYAAAYTKAFGQPGNPDPASTLVRDVFYVRGADYVITYDRATTTQPQFTKRLQWNFAAPPTVSGNSWKVSAGSSKLFGQTYSDAALTTNLQALNVNGTTVQEIQTQNASPTASVAYVTAMQVAGSGTAAMDSSNHVETADGKLEGVQIGAYVVLFGKNGAVSGGTSYQVTIPAGQTVTHYLSDMTPGQTYTLAGASQATATADSQGVVTFTTTGTGSAQTITLS